MRPSFSGLRTGILAQVLFLIIAAMLLVNLVMLSLSQRSLIQSKTDAGKILVQSLSLNLGRIIEASDKPLNIILQNSEFKKDIESLLSTGGFQDFVILDINGNPFLSTDLPAEDNKNLSSLAMISMQGNGISVNYRGSAWGVFWLSKKDIIVSGPLVYRGRRIGGAAITSSLDSIYKSLREAEKLVIFYIILDAIILALVGIYLLSRLVVNPIYRLLKMTEKYRDEDVLSPVTEYSGNEIGNLSRSLSSMLQRLDENKKELKNNISSLEKANLDLKQAQDEIIRSEKFASVGRLAAGIAHEIGNPLGIILGYLELIRKGDLTEDEKLDFLNRVESEITRINVIIRQLLDFSRPSSGNNEENSIHDIITDTVNMMKPHPLLDGISFRLDLKAERDTVFADSNQLQQVFLNIIMNAADVLKDKTDRQDDALDNILIMTDNKDNSIEIRFIDNGPGIDEETIQHIFDPFYTTKDPGKGTGLGLSVSYMIIESHGGTIRAESVKGKGASIIINLPVQVSHTQGDV
ncbi:MAG: HAMP domain-containing protein [Deltaproteobacteria bacterium]|nr:HAMP domain-containing protein [Deltaproteobacteria bacterium]